MGNSQRETPFRIGLFGIGLDSYWPQFEGLKSRLEGYLEIVHKKISDMHPAVINAGLVDNPVVYYLWRNYSSYYYSLQVV